MTLVVDIQHWLDAEGNIPTQHGPRFFRQALRVAMFVQYGGPIAIGDVRQTLVQCTHRPQRKACFGLLWVEKMQDGTIAAYCPVCEHEEARISNWQRTAWAGGMLEPVSPLALERALARRSLPN